MATTRFVDIQALSALVRTMGVPRFLETLAQTLREDFLRWPDFDKPARLASHSPLGVIELMPVSDATHYAFKYVNGHPANTARGLPTVMAFGVLAESYALEYPLNPEATLNPDVKPFDELEPPTVDVSSLNGPRVTELMTEAGLL